jgi:hypothetical protein
MKWIKTNEEYNNDNSIVTEIQNLSNDYLAYLIDKGVKVIVPWNREDDSCHIFIGNINTTIGNYISFNHSMSTIGLNWSDIKDDIIPFITILKDKYNINNIRLKKLDTRDQKVGAGVSYNIPLKDIIEDKLEDIDNIYYIRITIDI